MLSSLLTEGKSTKNSINQLFEKKFEITEKVSEENAIEEEQQQRKHKNQQEKQEDEQERSKRTLFVGNVHINAKKNDIRKLFVQYGEIEKVWFRSIPVDRSTKKEKVQLPVRAAVLIGKMQEGATSQTCYILFKDPKSAKSATQQDNQVFMNLHLRCSLDGQKKLDHIRTAFIGNLPFNIEEEQVRVAFEEAFGPVNYVRVIKDPQRHTGKGFGYVCFSEFLSLKNALQAQTIMIQDREVRIKKASEQTKRSVKEEFKNSINANQRIQKKLGKQQKQGKGKKRSSENKTSQKSQERVQIHKKIIKMKKKRVQLFIYNSVIQKKSKSQQEILRRRDLGMQRIPTYLINIDQYLQQHTNIMSEEVDLPTWAELAEEEDEELENQRLTILSENQDSNEISYQPGLTKSNSEYQPKVRNQRNPKKYRDNGGLKDYYTSEYLPKKYNNNRYQEQRNHQQRPKSIRNNIVDSYEETHQILIETTTELILIKIKPQNKSTNLEQLHQTLSEKFQGIQIFPRNDVLQIDLLTPPNIALQLLEEYKFKSIINGTQIIIQYPFSVDEPLTPFYAKRKYLAKEKKIQQATPLFQRSTLSSKSMTEANTEDTTQYTYTEKQSPLKESQHEYLDSNKQQIISLDQIQQDKQQEKQNSDQNNHQYNDNYQDHNGRRYYNNKQEDRTRQYQNKNQRQQYTKQQYHQVEYVEKEQLYEQKQKDIHNTFPNKVQHKQYGFRQFPREQIRYEEKNKVEEPNEQIPSEEKYRIKEQNQKQEKIERNGQGQEESNSDNEQHQQQEEQFSSKKKKNKNKRNVLIPYYEGKQTQ